MNEMKRDMIRIQELVGSAFGQTGALVALSDGGHMNPKKLQKTLEQTMEHFESAALELRRLCEQYSPGTGGFSKKSVLPAMDVTGSVEEFGYGWLHIILSSLTLGIGNLWLRPYKQAANAAFYREISGTGYAAFDPSYS